MVPYKVVFLGTPEFARFHLQELIRAKALFQVVGVISQPDRPAGRRLKLQKSPVKICAAENNIQVISPTSVNSLDVMEVIKEWRADCAVVVAYGQILPPMFLELFPAKVVNIHASLLPRWRGAAPFQRALMAGDQETGVALQVMVQKLDAGPIIGCRKIFVDREMEAVALHDILMNLGPELLCNDFIKYLNGAIQPVVQDETNVTYAKKISKTESLIDWSLGVDEIFNRIRALTMGPGTFTWRQQKKLKICWGTPVQLGSCLGEPGTVASCGDDNFVVACGSGGLKILSVQPQSKGIMDARSYLQGYSIKLEEQFGIAPSENQ